MNDRSLKQLINNHKKFLYYGLISVFVTIVDVFVSHSLESIVSVLTANTFGVFIGFLIQYFLTTKFVYEKETKKSFIVFFSTFFIGLIVANIIVYFSRTYLFLNNENLYAFGISKFLSIIIPFFIIYFIRKKFMPKTMN